MTSIIHLVREGLKHPLRTPSALHRRVVRVLERTQEHWYSTRADWVLSRLDQEKIRMQRPYLLAGVLGCKPAELALHLGELKTNACFQDFLREKRSHVVAEGSGTTEWIDCKTLYAIVRAIRPSIVVETGVQFGATSAHILLALQENQMGRLYSIDLPWPGLAPLGEQFGIGCMVPERLRHRWKIVWGDSMEELPKLLGELGSIDMFNHDSVHTYRFMTTEYNMAWPYIRPGGVLASHDVRRHNAFRRFCRRQGSAPFALVYNQGIALKRREG